MIGLALVTLVAMLATGIRASFFGAVDKIFVADYAVTAENNFDLIPTAIGQALQKVPGVHDVVGVRVGDMRVFGNEEHALAASTRAASKIFSLDWKEGSQAVLDTLGPTRRLHRQGLCEEARPPRRLEGADARRRAASGRPSRSRASSTRPSGGSPFGGPLTISSVTFDKLYTAPAGSVRRSSTSSGGATKANDAKLDQAIEGLPEREGPGPAGVQAQPGELPRATSSTSSTCCSRSR